jgi:hypothetical protein
LEDFVRNFESKFKQKLSYPFIPNFCKNFLSVKDFIVNFIKKLGFYFSFKSESDMLSVTNYKYVTLF